MIATIALSAAFHNIISMTQHFHRLRAAALRVG
jgi:hypothetical protein